MKKELFLLIAILIIGAFLRFYKLGNIPSGLYVDEAATGYNAYSILKTGKDEYGKHFPIAFRFFGSYSPPLYTYLTAPVISLKGLEITAVRFISALIGTLGILIMYLFLKNLKLIKSGSTPILVAFLFALTPWAIFFSRAGYELNLGFILLSLGSLFLWLAFKNPKFFIIGFPVLSLSTYGAHAERFLVPLFILLFLILFRKELFSRNKSQVLTGLAIALVMQIPNLYLLMTPSFFTKSDLFFKNALIEQSLKISKLFPSFVSLPLAFAREFLSRFLVYFSPRSLFFLEDPDPQRSAPGLSLFYPWVVILYLVGFYVLFRNIKELSAKFITFLLVVFTLPLALTSDPFSSQRGLHLLLPLTLIVGLGADFFIGRWKKVAIVSLVLANLASLIFLWRSYFVLVPHERAKIWGYGFSQLAEEIKGRQNDLFLIDQARIKPAYIELAFFLKYPPEKLQNSVDKDIQQEYYSNVEFSDAYKFANIETRNIEWEKDIYKKQILVGDEYSISDGQAKEHFLSKIFEIKDPTGEIVFVGFATNPEKKCLETGNLSLYCNKPN